MEYLHMKQIIHKDMKSANVLVWKFPSGRLAKEKRVEKASSVWLKLTDYGISQVFTKPTMNLTGDPEGTPGFMAPELFGPVGHEISTEKVRTCSFSRPKLHHTWQCFTLCHKDSPLCRIIIIHITFQHHFLCVTFLIYFQVDVFAFGMVIYELLSLQAPFASVEVRKRNSLVIDGKRPLLPVKGLWSPLMAQDIMTMCWSHDPDRRPDMKTVTQWVTTEEFRRLRAEMSIEKVESVSCACVCRITVDDKREDDETDTLSNGIGHIEAENSVNSALRFDVGGYRGISDMDPCTDYTRLQYETQSFHTGRNILPPLQNERGTITTDGSEESFDTDTKRRERSSYLRQFSSEAYTQVWVCDKKERGGLLEIFSYCDTQPSYLVSNPWEPPYSL